jgi:hypothetical protein
VGSTGGETDWHRITSQLFIDGKTTCPTIDLFPAHPNVIYLATTFPRADTEMEIYQSDDEGHGWYILASYATKGPTALEGPYNPFIRSHPTLSNHVYFGGVKLYELAPQGNDFVRRRIDGIHDDQKWLEFPPGYTGSFWALNDGGIWQVTQFGASINVAWPLNHGLRTMEFYDLDCSATDPNLMIGGTQDNGTMVWQGQPAWRSVQGGDGNFSLISPTDNHRFYAQYQFLADTRRTDKGVNADDWPVDFWTGCAKGLPTNGWKIDQAFITADPTDGTHLLSQGDQVYETTNSGGVWVGRGPTGLRAWENIHRVLFQPPPAASTWLAGTSQGRLWMRRQGIWTSQFDHTNGAGVLSMAFAPTDPWVLYVLFDAPAGADRRVYRFVQLPPPANNWVAAPISGQLPVNIIPTVICGDGYSAEVVYVGTAAGVYRGQYRVNGGWQWQPYNDGLPLVEITDLLVDRTSKQLRAGTMGRGAWAVITGP